MINFYFVRHGETIWNKTGRYQGSTDVPLSELGHEQAEKAALWFQKEHFDGVISSPLRRARETAEAIAAEHHLDVEIDPLLQELCFGDWEGKTAEEIEKLWPGMIEKMYRRPELLSLPHGESFADCQKRGLSAIRNLTERGDEKSYVIVSHGAILRTIVCGMLQLPLSRAWNFSFSNTGITNIYHYPMDMNVLHFLNLTEHLR